MHLRVRHSRRSHVAPGNWYHLDSHPSVVFLPCCKNYGDSTRYLQLCAVILGKKALIGWWFKRLTHESFHSVLRLSSAKSLRARQEAGGFERCGR